MSKATTPNQLLKYRMSYLRFHPFYAIHQALFLKSVMACLGGLASLAARPGLAISFFVLLIAITMAYFVDYVFIRRHEIKNDIFNLVRKQSITEMREISAGIIISAESDKNMIRLRKSNDLVYDDLAKLWARNV